MNAVRFNILGPLEVLAGGRPVHLGGPRPRATMALLLLNDGHAVSVERLIDLVWGDDPPQSARGQVAIAVSGLRRALKLAGADPALIETVGAGYRVLAPSLDAREAEELIARARRSAPEQGAPLLEQALGLWRGPVLEGLGRVTDAAERWSELRPAVHEEWAGLELELGRHAEVIDRLAAFVAEHPLRERSRAQLMLALHRCGRRAEALELYRSGHQLLAEELGLEPGTELRELHQAILLDDPGLQARRDDRGGPVPSELPADPAAFTGRTEELKRLTTLLGEGRAVIAAIAGAGGMGKSALAVKAAHLAAHEFPDGHLYVNLHGSTPGVEPVQPVEVLGRFLRSFGVPPDEVPDNPDEAAGRFRSLTSRRRVLVVLDNALDSAQVRPLLPAGAGCAVVVTSRGVLSTLDGATHLRLTPLAEEEAAAMVPGSPAERAELVRLCGGLPLALRIVAAQLAADPGTAPADLIVKLADERRRLDALQQDDLAVRAGLALSVQRLAPEDARLFAALGVLDAYTFTPALAGAMLGRETESGFARLTAAGLLEPLGPGGSGSLRYGTHDLILLHARELAAALDDRDELLDRGANCYFATTITVHAAMQAGELTGLEGHEPTHPGLPLATAEQAVAWLDAETPDLVTASLQLLREPRWYPLGVRLARTLGRVLLHRGGIRELTLLAGESVAAARAAGDTEQLAESHNMYGVALLITGRLAEGVAQVESATALWKALDDRPRQASALSNMAMAHLRMGRPDRAIAAMDEAVAIRREAGDGEGLADALDNLGILHARTGDLDRALVLAQEALDLRRGLRLTRAQGVSYTNLADLYRMRGEPRLALGCLDEALALARTHGDQLTEAAIQWQLGDTRAELGDEPEARLAWAGSVAILVDSGLMTADEGEAHLTQPRPGPPGPIGRGM
ncbi:BTAD domain-containing putative transcriptional regulator [Nonomuraea sp. NPDC050328]|uniref:AfsR/SARP family transcriptional regulator n=1 Tax=Nonomuraea sp. NPDC050328 TaxID=3364361 RepID=UPI0037B7CCEB